MIKLHATKAQKGGQIKLSQGPQYINNHKLTPSIVQENLREPFLQMLFLNQVLIFCNFMLNPIKDQVAVIKLSVSESKDFTSLQDKALAILEDIQKSQTSSSKQICAPKIAKRILEHENMWAKAKDNIHKQDSKAITLQNFMREPRKRLAKAGTKGHCLAVRPNQLNRYDKFSQQMVKDFKMNEDSISQVKQGLGKRCLSKRLNDFVQDICVDMDPW